VIPTTIRTAAVAAITYSVTFSAFERPAPSVAVDDDLAESMALWEMMSEEEKM
jgi:hypothetical protein